LPSLIRIYFTDNPINPLSEPALRPEDRYR
jgi:hypothetical protein